MPKRRLIKSMFHRRLLLLLAAFSVGCLGLTAQLGRLTLLEGSERRAAAEARLVRRVWTPTVRGRILDRKDRVLAYDRPSYAVQFHYDVLTGAWAEQQARRYAPRAHSDAWSTLPRAERDALIARYTEIYSRHLDAMWRTLAEQAGVRPEELLARRDAIVRRVEAMHEHVSRTRYLSLMKDRTRAGRPPTEQEEAAIRRRASAPLAEQMGWHAVLSGVEDKAGFELMRRVGQQVPIHTAVRVPGANVEVALEETVEQFPTMRVENSIDRVYPFETVPVDIDLAVLPPPLRKDGRVSIEVRGVATHILGRLRDRVYAEDAEARREALRTDAELRARAVTPDGVDRGAYRDKDRVGAAGVEGGREHELRGLRGLRIERIHTGEIVETPPEPGRDVRVTIDAMLQARIQAIMDPRLGLASVQEWHGHADDESNGGPPPVGTPLAGAVVVLEIDTGDILALVSTPEGVPEEIRDDPEARRLFEETFQPHVNRAIARPYPPGSIAKIVALNGAVLSGHYRMDEGIVDRGHLLPNRPDVYRDWYFKRYGATRSPAPDYPPVRAAESLMWSNNTFYYTLGQRMGPDRMAECYRMFGVGRAFGLGIGPEWPGAFTLDGSEPTNLTVDNAILMAIGQGPVTWTPLHAANAYATLARAGVWVEPRLIDDPRDPQEVRDLRLNRAAVAESIRGLDLAINNAQGTGHAIGYGEPWGRHDIFDVPGVQVWGKTGTATAPPLVVDPDGDGPEKPRAVRSGDHAWFVVAVGPEGEDVRYVVAVVIDYGGSGGRVAGPICNEVVRALRTEGYLERSSLAGGGSR